MNTFLKAITISLLFVLAFSSCKKDQKADEYYVKYLIRANGTFNSFDEFTVNTNQGEKAFSGLGYGIWNQTYGPVKKGFVASVSVSDSRVTVEIYVSKNNGNMILVASKTGDNSLSTGISQSYTIDY